MRLAEVATGDTVAHRLLIRVISLMAGYRLPDAARVAFYDKAFAGPALGSWTQRAMRGESGWTIAERELMAAMIASWNSCPFCVGAHRAIAVHGVEPEVVDAVLSDYRTAPISERLRAALAFIERLTTDPGSVAAADAQAAMAAGLSRQDIEDAAAVASVFAVITRNANALDFEIPTAEEFDRAAGMLLRRGYS